jgi:acyl carrier protein
VLTIPGVAEIAVSTCDLSERYQRWAIGESATRWVSPEPLPAGDRHERPDSLGAYVVPQDGIEQQVAQVWADVLGFENIGANDDFFRLGGHSISAIRIVARLRDTLGADISVASLLTQPTVSKFCAAIAGAAEAGADV